MLKTLKMAGLSALIGFSALAAAPTAAQADSFYFGFGVGGPTVRYYDGDRYGYRDRYEAPRRKYRRACTPHRAVRKAARMGIRNARVVRANRNVIKVVGRQHRQKTRVVFARAPRCPIIRMR